jgi:cytochrome c-type biogenesis protein CcmH
MGVRMRRTVFSLVMMAVLGVWPTGLLAGSVEEQTHLLAAELRCPVCQNLSVGDSPSEMANQMRDMIREKLKNGESPDQVRAYFVSRYGEWILLAPKRQGFNWVAWLLPFCAILAGAGAIGWVVRRGAARGRARQKGELPPLDPRYAGRLEAELKEWGR